MRSPVRHVRSPAPPAPRTPTQDIVDGIVRDGCLLPMACRQHSRLIPRPSVIILTEVIAPPNCRAPSGCRFYSWRPFEPVGQAAPGVQLRNQDILRTAVAQPRNAFGSASARPQRLSVPMDMIHTLLVGCRPPSASNRQECV